MFLVNNNKKKNPKTTLEQKMGLEEGVDTNAPAAPTPDLFPNMAADSLKGGISEEQVGQLPQRFKDRRKQQMMQMQGDMNA